MLSDKKKTFAEEYAKCRNATAAARKAGYQKNHSQIGSNLLKEQEVQDYLKVLYEKALTDKVATIKEVMEFFTKVMNDEDEATKNRISAASELKDILTKSDKTGESKEAPVFNFTFVTHRDNETN